MDNSPEQAPFLQQARARGVETDEDEGDVHAHERADEVEHVLVIGAVRA
ncbi:hypothetical protein [Nonomuraea rhodomycinica]|nr:hypothetical protein [Nonomuraea rhodomycinica]